MLKTIFQMMIAFILTFFLLITVITVWVLSDPEVSQSARDFNKAMKEYEQEYNKSKAEYDEEKLAAEEWYKEFKSMKKTDNE